MAIPIPMLLRFHIVVFAVCIAAFIGAGCGRTKSAVSRDAAVGSDTPTSPGGGGTGGTSRQVGSGGATSMGGSGGIATGGSPGSGGNTRPTTSGIAGRTTGGSVGLQTGGASGSVGGGTTEGGTGGGIGSGGATEKGGTAGSGGVSAGHAGTDGTGGAIDGGAGDAPVDGGTRVESPECLFAGGTCEELPMSPTACETCPKDRSTAFAPAPPEVGPMGCTSRNDAMAPICCLPIWGGPGDCWNAGGECYPPVSKGNACPIGWSAIWTACSDDGICCTPGPNCH